MSRANEEHAADCSRSHTGDGLSDVSMAFLIAPVVTTTSITLNSNKSRIETFWYRLTQVHLENDR